MRPLPRFSEVGLRGERGFMKLGARVPYVHTKVPGFSKLRERIFAVLKGGSAFWRTNWALAPSGELTPVTRDASEFSRTAGDPSHSGVVYDTEGTRPEAMWLKVEYQCVRPVTDGYALFTIRTHADQLSRVVDSSVGQKACRVLAAHVDELPVPKLRYAGLDDDARRAAIVDYLRRPQRAPVYGFRCELLSTPVSEADRHKIYTLLAGYGDHYADHFGPDFLERLGAASGTDGSGLVVAVARDGSDEIVSHASVAYDGSRPGSPGALGAVFTAPSARRNGLSKELLGLVLGAWDASRGGVLVLGTGSPHASRTYAARGFEAILGDLAGNHRGYNPADVGEVIMVRGPNKWDPLELYASRDADDFVVEALRRDHWAGLILLLTAFESADPKLPAAGIDTGLEAEEQLLKLMRRGSAAHARVAVAPTGMIHGLRVALDGGRPDMYVAPTATRRLRDALESPTSPPCGARKRHSSLQEVYGKLW